MFELQRFVAPGSGGMGAAERFVAGRLFRHENAMKSSLSLFGFWREDSIADRPHLRQTLRQRVHASFQYLEGQAKSHPPGGWPNSPDFNMRHLPGWCIDAS
ncbi:MAG: hypothetical protein DKINENOH_00952 [bacterium]|nr:hypothetical protein [bacterium]